MEKDVMQVTADIKCYYCGHISGQLIADPGRPHSGTFRPRPGFAGNPPKAGERIRCERCKGPVFLEDVSPMEIPVLRRPRAVAQRKLSGAA
jgi:DNA-directed RNA polymerase subunit RPC12/RpoP